MTDTVTALSDRELLACAAKSYFNRAPKHIGEGVLDWVRDCVGEWNPLTDDGDAFRLAVKLQLEVFVYPGYARATNTTLFSAVENISVPSKGVRNDPYAATRRAIVRAAAAIGESM